MSRKSARLAARETKNDKKPSGNITTISCRSDISTTYEWYFLDINNNWIKYGYKDSSRNGTNASILSEDIEKHYLVDECGSILFHTQAFRYVLKFDTMEQMNLTTERVRPVHRRPVKKRNLSLAAKEEYLPNLTDSNPTKTNVRIEPLIEMLNVFVEIGKIYKTSVNRNEVNDQKGVEIKVEFLNHASTTWIMPSFWNPMNDDESLLVVPIVSTSQEYKDVMSYFAATSVIANTVIIKRVQNPYLFIPYKIRQKELSIKYGTGTQLNVQKLFHGTKEEHVISICKENFDWRLHGTNGKESFGMGTYFSNSALVSQAYSIPNVYGHRFMFLADVIVGTAAQGDGLMTQPPKNLTTGEPYDTTVDNIVAPQKFVKYDKQDYYPSYIIEFW